MLNSSLVPAFLLAAGGPSIANQLVDALFNNPFKGIHRLVFFDYAMLVPYFAVLIVLSCYGLHRYEMIRGYWKHRKKLLAAVPLRQFDVLPRVTIQLPITGYFPSKS